MVVFLVRRQSNKQRLQSNEQRQLKGVFVCLMVFRLTIHHGRESLPESLLCLDKTEIREELGHGQGY